MVCFNSKSSCNAIDDNNQILPIYWFTLLIFLSIQVEVALNVKVFRMLVEKVHVQITKLHSAYPVNIRHIAIQVAANLKDEQRSRFFFPLFQQIISAQFLNISLWSCDI